MRVEMECGEVGEVGYTFKSEEDPESEIIFTFRRRVDMTKETKVVVVLYHPVSTVRYGK